jgi:glycosyltransferase involved in cell wall biosynthesis
MACGCPVVMTDSLGIRDYAINEINALIVAKNPIVIATAVDKLLSNESQKQHLVKEGLKTASNFSLDAAVMKLENFFTHFK